VRAGAHHPGPAPWGRAADDGFSDAEAIAAAVMRPTVGYPPLRTPAELDLQALHRAGVRLMSRCAGVIT